MQAIYSDAHAQHDPQMFLVRGQVRQSAEQPARADRLLQGARAAGLEIAAPGEHGRGLIAAVHTPEYLDFLEHGHAAWSALEGAGPEIIPNVHRAVRPAHYPRAIVGRAGWHQADTACPIGPGTWAASYAAAQSAISASLALAAGAREVYALCRPPGHHAYADMAGGFCFLNNSAIAAETLRQRGAARVAVFDMDVHHGNGTQGIFYRRADVLTVSIHADPADYYPFFWGYAAERGAGDGEGYNLNLPMPLGTGDAAWLAAIKAGLARVRAFGADALVVALGLDASASDPLQGMQITRDGFECCGALIGAAGYRSVLVQEGGYLSEDLGDNLAAFLEGFRGAR